METNPAQSVHWPLFNKLDDEGEIDDDDPCYNMKTKELVECYEKPCKEDAKPMNGNISERFYLF